MGKQRTVFLTLSCFIFLLSLVINKMSIFNLKNSTLYVFDRMTPSSPDPYEFDSRVNHIVYGPVFAKLFTFYKDAKLAPYLVESWKVSDSDSKWTFKIRTDFQFSNGERIKPFHIKEAIKRVFLLSNKSSSSLSWKHLVIGAENLSSMRDEIEGIKATDDSLMINLTRGEAGLPELLSFGLFGISHPSNYDEVTGEWNGSNLVSSGPYLIEQGSSEARRIHLKLRSDFPLDGYVQNAFKQIVFSFDPAERERSHIIQGKDDEKSPGEDYLFKGMSGAGVTFLQFLSWGDPNSPFFDREIRKDFRNLFYKNLKNAGINPVLSIFPLIHSGVEEVGIDFNISTTRKLNGRIIKLRKPNNLQSPKIKTAWEVLKNTVVMMEGTVVEIDDVSSSQIIKLWKQHIHLSPKFDLAFRGTMIGQEDPRETTKFMFSSEGIFLPDPSGSAHALFRELGFSLNKINKVIFDDAIIWPVFHETSGFWVHKGVDLSRYNHSLPMSELQWIGN